MTMSVNAGEFSRFNLPFELGLDMGSKLFGGKKFSGKKMIVLDNTYHDYDKYLGDLSGQDILVHLNDPRSLMNEIRNWFSRIFLNRTFVGTDLIWHDFLFFNKNIQDQFKDSWSQEDMKNMQMSEYRKFALEWIKKQKKQKRIQ